MAASESKLYQNVAFDNILKCVHCGLCLDACPTYRELGAEQDSPRGRLYLMRGLWEGELEPDAEVLAPLQRCLDCRACESACPSGVPYGELLEKTRAVVKPHEPGNPLVKILVSFFLKRLLPSTGGLLWMARFARLWQLLGFHRLSARLLPAGVARTQQLMPRFAASSFKKTFRGNGGDGPLVALFSGCIMDVCEQEIHQATVDLLIHAGYRVVTPPGQTCCGALQVHAGERETARKLARHNLEVFGDPQLQAVVVNSAGCGAQLKELHLLFEYSPIETNSFESKVTDLMALLAGSRGFTDAACWDNTPITVLYDAPCHLIHAQKIDAQPRSLLESLPGVTLVTPRESSRCCGAAGIYNLLNGPLSEQVLARKMDDLEATMESENNATILLTANPGCLFQLRHGAARRGLPLEVMHPAVFMARRLEHKRR